MARLAYALLVTVMLVGCGNKPGTTDVNAPSGTNLPEYNPKGFQSLGIEDKTPGTGPAAKKGDTVVVIYRGTFRDGTEFDSNMNAELVPNTEKDPYPVIIGTASVIKGWDEGLVGTKEGMVRKLNVPYKMAYGDEGQGDKIPPRSDMIFTLKILKVIPAGVKGEIEGTDVTKGNGPAVTMASTVTMKYKGTLLNGKIFDDQTEKPLTVQVARLIPGFKEVIQGMQAGGKRKISWPPGSPNPTGQIPPNQPVEYIVEMVSVK